MAFLVDFPNVIQSVSEEPWICNLIIQSQVQSSFLSLPMVDAWRRRTRDRGDTHSPVGLVEVWQSIEVSSGKEKWPWEKESFEFAQSSGRKNADKGQAQLNEQ